jgi:hypothetical protein
VATELGNWLALMPNTGHPIMAVTVQHPVRCGEAFNTHVMKTTVSATSFAGAAYRLPAARYRINGLAGAGIEHERVAQRQ